MDEPCFDEFSVDILANGKFSVVDSTGRAYGTPCRSHTKAMLLATRYNTVFQKGYDRGFEVGRTKLLIDEEQ